MTESSHPMPPFPREFFEGLYSARPNFHQVKEYIIPLTERGKAFVVKKGQAARIICVEGPQVADVCIWNADNYEEYFWNEFTLSREGLFLTTFSRLWSNMPKLRPMMTIIEDTYKGTHDLQYGMCSKSTYDLWWELRDTEHWRNYFHNSGIDRREDLPNHGCWENLTDALNPYDIAPEDIPSPFNLFQSYEISLPTGKLVRCLDRDRPKPGKPAHVEFRAEMNCLAVVSACPESGKGGRAKSIRIEVLAPTCSES